MPTKPEAPARPLLRTEEAAEMLALSPRTLRNWASAGTGPPVVKLGGAIRYRSDDLAAWIDAQRRGPHAA